MTIKINGRTPEEIKKGLECHNCGKCVYNQSGDFYCEQVDVDALAYIQQLEDLFRDLTKKVEQLERERDAAVAETESLKAEIDAINEDYLSGIHTVREDVQPKWISVEERLPGDPLDGVGDVVELLIDKGDAKEVLPGYYDHDEKDWVIYFGDILGEYRRKAFSWWRVIKWRPFPEPPKEG